MSERKRIDLVKSMGEAANVVMELRQTPVNILPRYIGVVAHVQNDDGELTLKVSIPGSDNNFLWYYVKLKDSGAIDVTFTSIRKLSMIVISSVRDKFQDVLLKINEDTPALKTNLINILDNIGIQHDNVEIPCAEVESDELRAMVESAFGTRSPYTGRPPYTMGMPGMPGAMPGMGMPGAMPGMGMPGAMPGMGMSTGGIQNVRDFDKFMSEQCEGRSPRFTVPKADGEYYSIDELKARGLLDPNLETSK